MATDVLSEPLGKDNSKKKRRWRPQAGWIGAGIFLSVIATMTLWVVFVDDPLGGEPVVIVAIERQASGVRKADVEVVEIRQSLPSSEEKDAAAESDAGAAPPPEIEFTDDGLTDSAEIAALSKTPLEKLTEKGRYGNLPKMADDGSRPLDLYAAPVPRAAMDSPKIILVVTGLGLSQTGTEEAIRILPSGVTLAFAPYGSSLGRWVGRARQEGHELLLQVPLEPFDFPDNDPGPHTLLTNLSAAQNLDRLQWLLARIGNYVGIINYMGARFTAAPDSFAPVLQEMESRGLLYMDDGSSSRSEAERLAGELETPFVKADLTIDGLSTPEAIDAQLLQLESLSRSRGLAIGVASALPVSVKRITEWALGLEARGVYLIPPSFVARTGRS